MIRYIASFLALTACVTALHAAPAYAQTSRIYLAGYLGLNTYNPQDFSESTAPASGEIALDNSASFAGAIGLRLSNQVRIEAEIAYQKSDFDSAKLDTGATFNTGGDLTTWLGLLNVYYDFDVPWRLQPFIGAGIGMGMYDASITTGFAPAASDDTMALAYQAGGGLKYRISPDLALTGAYRYLGSTDLDFTNYKMDYATHEFRIGLEYDLPVAKK